MKINRNGWLESETERQCTNCLELFPKTTNNTMRLCRKCNTTRVKSQSAVSKMFSRAKRRAKDRDVVFDIEMSDIVIPKVCPILGIELFCTSGRSGAFKNSPSLDRIDPEEGYIKGNIQVISQLANVMKSNATTEDLVMFAKWVLQNY